MSTSRWQTPWTAHLACIAITIHANALQSTVTPEAGEQHSFADILFIGKVGPGVGPRKGAGGSAKTLLSMVQVCSLNACRNANLAAAAD